MPINTMNEKRSIDRIRDSGGHMEIGTPDDPSNITAMLSIGDVLYAIKEKGIYAVKLADSIDPKRTNPNIPPVQQRVFGFGSESPVVGQTLLTAKQLFNEQVLPEWFDCKSAISWSFEALKDLAAMHEVKEAFNRLEKVEIEAFNKHSKMKGALVLPAISDVDIRCKTFFQKADHASRSLLSIVKLFYKKKGEIKGFGDLAKLTLKLYGKDDGFTTYLGSVAPTLKYIRQARNCLEHPNPPTKQAVVLDFILRPDGAVVSPSVEVISSPDTYPAVEISVLMEQLTEALPRIFEGILVCLCGKHMNAMGGFETHMLELPPERRRGDKKHVRFSYGVKIGNEITPLS